MMKTKLQSNYLGLQESLLNDGLHVIVTLMDIFARMFSFLVIDSVADIHQEAAFSMRIS